MSSMIKKSIIHVDSDINRLPNDYFERMVKSWFMNPADIHIIDLSMTTELDGEHIETFTYYIKTLNERSKEVYLFSACDELQSCMKSHDSSALFNFIESLDEIISAA